MDNFFTSRFEIADCNAHIPAFAAIRGSSGAERLVKSVSLQVFTTNARCNVLYNVAPVLFSSFVIPDLLCGLSQLKLCDIIFIPDTQPPSAPALVIFHSSGLCRQIVHKEQWRRASNGVEPLFFVYFRLDYYECVLFFVKNVDFSNYRNFYTHTN